MNPFRAVSEGNAEALRAALDADPSLAGAANPDGISLVRWALYQGRGDLADLVLAHDPPLDVFDAAAVGNAERLRKVAANHDRSLASARSSDGFTPLHFAAFLGTVECAAVLLGVGADPAAMASGAMTVQPLHSAAASGNLGVSRPLLDAGAPIEATQSGGFTPLHEAAHRGDAALVALLLERGAMLLALLAIMAIGWWLGEVSVKGVTRGNAGVLFVALIFGHCGMSRAQGNMDLGLLLFVYAVGLQAGPRFFRYFSAGAASSTSSSPS